MGGGDARRMALLDEKPRNLLKSCGLVCSIHRVRNSHKFDALRQWDFHPIAAAGSIIEGQASRQGRRGWIFALTVH